MQDLTKLSDDDLFARYSACNRAMDMNDDHDLFGVWDALQREIDRREEARYRAQREAAETQSGEQA